MTTRKLNNAVEIQIISHAEEFGLLKDVWNDVLTKSGIHNAFLTHEWLSSWWNNYGKDKELMILKFSHDDHIIGFIPLMKYTAKLTGLRVKAIGFLTNHWTRMNFILTSQVDECLKSFASYIKESKEIFILAQMDHDHEIYQKLCRVLNEQDISFTDQDKLHAYVHLKGRWDDYFNCQSKNFRMDSRRKLKRLERGGTVILKRSKSEDTQTVLNQLKTVAANCWQAKDNVNVISTNEGFHFYQDICENALNGFVLDFTVLTVCDQPIAYMFGLIKDEHYFAFETAYDKDFEEFSPGLILHNLLMEELFKDKIKIFDFGFNANYKKRWSSQTFIASDLVIFPKGLTGDVLKFGQRIKKMVKQSSMNCTAAMGVEKPKSTLVLEVVNTLEGFRQLKNEWNDLLNQSASAGAFMSFEWLFSWWQGYHEGKDLLILELVDNKKTVCIAPLMVYHTTISKVPVKAIGFVGNHWMGGEFIFDSNVNKEECVRIIMEHLVQLRKLVILSYFREHTITQNILTQEMDRIGIKYFYTQRPVPIIKKAGSWENYLKSRGNKFRYEYRTALKVADKLGKIELVTLNDFDIEATLADIRKIALKNWKGKEGVAIVIEKGGEPFYRELFKDWIPKKYIRLSFLKLNEERIAYLIGFMMNGYYYAFDISFDEKYKKMMPGVVIFNKVIEELFHQGFSVFDFNYNAGYISRWTDESAQVADLMIFPKGLRGSVLELGNRIKKTYQQNQKERKNA